MTQSYSYDSLNRLETASETAGGGTAWPAITYGMDRYGNRWVQSGYKPAATLTPQAQTEFDAATNRMVSPSGYDNAGNLIVDKVGRSFKYDAENHQVEFNPNISGIPATTYAYDRDARRVKKSDGTNTTLFVYNAGGQLVAEYTTQPASGSGGISYLTTDHLGSTRLVTTNGPTVKTRHDYLPYGEEIDIAYGGRGSIPAYTATLIDGPNQKFTSKERDLESNLDYFLARYHSGAQGRFTSADAPFADQYESDPQSWNLYHYGRNNPLRFTDPTGRKCVDTSNGKADDGTGGGCPEAGVDDKGNIKSQQVTVHADPLIDDLRFQLFRLEFNRANDANLKAAGLVAAGSALIGITGGLGANALYHPAILTSLRLSAPLAPEFGRKLDFIFGQATVPNVQRSVGMLQELRKIGINDTAESRTYVANHLTQVLNDASNIVQRAGDRTIRESFLMGPTGGVKLESVWEGTKLITVKIFGGGS